MKADVFTMGQAKDAALLYEGVVCLVPDEVAVSDDVLQRKILQILAPSRLQKPYEEFLDTYFKNKALSSLRASLRDNSLSLGGIFSALMDEDLYRVFDDVGKIYNESKDAGLEALVGRRFLQKAEEPSAVVSLLDIDLIDTRSVEWDAILELRKDPDAFRRIRKLRNYMRSEMAGKSAEQIRDEILEQIEDYKVAARANGLLLKKGQIETVIPKLGPAQSLGIYAFFKGLSIFSWEAFAVAGKGSLSWTKRISNLRRSMPKTRLLT
jgi:hypothetical protein